WSVYTLRDKAYMEHRRNVKELTSWMQDTIAPNYRMAFLKPEEEIHVWYDSISKIGAAAQSSLRQEVRAQYRAMVSRPLPKVPKDLGAWVTKWEAIVARGIDKGLTELTAPDNLMADLEITLQGVIPDWTTSFRMVNRAAINAGLLTYIDIAAGLREYALTRLSPLGGGKALKGAFLTYGTNEQEETDEDDQVQDKPDRFDFRCPRGRGHGRASNRGRGSQRAIPKRPRADTQECWYALPEKAPTHWTAQPLLRQAVLQTIKNDPDLAREVARLSGKKRDTKVEILDE
ncbi:hypothetical protein F5Y03DRAFT_380796, partial [Xylaria venustula]